MSLYDCPSVSRPGSCLLTNKIHDEFAFIMELSHHLSERYNRPLGCIVVTLHHRMCLFFGGTFAPAYCITISALPSQIQTATNKRNLLLLQLHLEKTLKVFPTRGIVRYLPVEEDCFGWNKRTIASEMAEVETQGSEVEVGEVRRRRTLPVRLILACFDVQMLTNAVDVNAKVDLYYCDRDACARC